MSSLPAMPLEGKENEFQLSSEQQIEIASIPFQGKSLTHKDGQKPMTILLHGPPGSGKSCEGHALYQQLPNVTGTIFVSYDDYGALFDMPDYTDGLKSLRASNQYTYEKREELFLKYRQDSQRIRSLTFGKVVEEGWDALVDTTASGPGTFKMVETLRGNDRDLVARSYWAPIALAEERLQERADRTGRVLEEAQTTFAKRVGAMETLPRMISEIGDFTFSLNEKQGSSAQELFKVKDGQIVYGDKDFRSRLASLFRADVTAFAVHENGLARAHAERLGAVTEKAIAYLETLPWSPDLVRNKLDLDRPIENQFPKQTFRA